MHQSLGKDDGMNILWFCTITFSDSHLTRASHEISYDDKQIVHHGSEEQHESYNA